MANGNGTTSTNARTNESANGGTDCDAPKNPLGDYLKSRRAKLDPVAFGYAATRRRTPGLRREEVAQRANVSATWYTWLEQGRGGTPSADVLDGIADALALSPVEREHLFLLAQQRPPQVRYRTPEPVSPQLQRVIDALPYSPVVVKTPAWDVVAWNRAAAAVLADYASIPAERRNILRFLFCEPESRRRNLDWESVARGSVAAFRTETARAGASERAKQIVAELSAASPEFTALWREHDVEYHGEGVKRLRLGPPAADTISFEYSTFTVDGRPDLGLLVFNPATAADAAQVRALLDARPEAKGSAAG